MTTVVKGDFPEFRLTETDPLAPSMVMMWACFVNGDLAGALAEFNHIAQEVLPRFEEKPAPQDVIESAVSCAELMEEKQGLTEPLELPS